MIEAYREGLKALEEGDVLFAAKNFNVVENIYLNQFGLQDRY